MRSFAMKKAASLFALMTLCSFVASSAQQNITSVTSPTEREVTINISDAYIPGGFDSTSDAYVVLNGLFPNSCYKWSRADVINAGNNVHEVRSVATVSQGMCMMVIIPFTKEVRIGQLPSGKHKVRFMNGDGTYLEKDLVVE
jgi:hypothetical protein